MLRRIVVLAAGLLAAVLLLSWPDGPRGPLPPRTAGPIMKSTCAPALTET